MIYDCFTFFNESDLLEIRLNELNSIVDKFVIVEANQTFTGISKKFNFQKFKKITQPFKEKIIYIKVNLNNSPDVRKLPNYIPAKHIEKNPETWSREIFQRNCISDGLINAKSNDIIMISDIDEIPNINKIKNIKDDKLIYGFEQNFFYYYLNCINSEEKWIGTKATYFKNLKTPQELRMSNSYKIIKNGGWHFSYLGGIEKIKEKLNSFSHQEFNTTEINNLNKIKFNIENNLDILERPISYKTIKIDETFPKHIIKNINKYNSYIKKNKKNNKNEEMLIEEINKNRKNIDIQKNEIEKTTSENKNYLLEIDKLIKENEKLQLDLNISSQENEKLQLNLNISNKENEKLQSDLNKIQSSKTYKIWQKFNKIKRLFI